MSYSSVEVNGLTAKRNSHQSNDLQHLYLKYKYSEGEKLIRAKFNSDLLLFYTNIHPIHDPRATHGREILCGVVSP